MSFYLHLSIMLWWIVANCWLNCSFTLIPVITDITCIRKARSLKQICDRTINIITSAYGISHRICANLMRIFWGGRWISTEWINLDVLQQECGTHGPRAGYGPLKHFIRPACMWLSTRKNSMFQLLRFWNWAGIRFDWISKFGTSQALTLT